MPIPDPDRPLPQPAGWPDVPFAQVVRLDAEIGRLREVLERYRDALDRIAAVDVKRIPTHPAADWRTLLADLVAIAREALEAPR